MSDERETWLSVAPPPPEPPKKIREPDDEDDDPDPEDETLDGDDEETSKVPDAAEVIAVASEAAKPKPRIRVKRSVEECEGLVSGIDDETVATLLSVLAKEAVERGLDPMIPVMAAKTTASGAPRVSMNDLWGRIITRIDRSKKGGFRFEGSPIYGRSILGRDLSSIGVGEDGRVAPVVFGRKDMRGTMWLAVAEKGASFDMSGTTVAGMALKIWSNNFDDFERLCNVAESLLSGVGTDKVEKRRASEATLADLDNWE